MLLPMEPRVRTALPTDVRAINAIYNHYVRTSTCTWHLTEETDEGRQAWLRGRTPAHPVLVVEIGGKVVGWGALSTYNTRQGWSTTVEDSVFIDHAYHGQGLGKLMLGELLRRAEALGHESVIARISGEQTASRRLHAALGFVEAGLLAAVGRKFGQKLDCVYMLRTLRLP
jgi:L-amino acid N-acyltransferase YncA